jgi:hypothetical protein
VVCDIKLYSTFAICHFWNTDNHFHIPNVVSNKWFTHSNQPYTQYLVPPSTINSNGGVLAMMELGIIEIA